MLYSAIGSMCPNCYQNGYVPNAVFHYCGDKSIQCKECGKDMPRKITLPYKFTWHEGGLPHFIVAWQAVLGGQSTTCLVTQGGFAKDSTTVLSRQETLKLLKLLNLSSLQIPGYQPPPREEKPMEVVIQKVKLPYPFQPPFDSVFLKSPEEYNLMTDKEKEALEQKQFYIEGWSEKENGCLLVRDGDIFTTLTKEETADVLKWTGLHPANINGYKEPKKKKKKIRQLEENESAEVRIESVSLLEWEQFLRWRERSKEVEESSDEILSGTKALIESVTSSYSEFDDDFDDLLENVRKLPRVIRYVRCGEEPSMDMDDDNLCYFDESQLLNPSWVGVKAHDRYAKKKMKVTVVIEDISDGKL